MTPKDPTAGDPIPEGNPNSGKPQGLEIERGETLDPRNLITGNEGLERPAANSKRPKAFGDVDLGIDPGEDDKPSPKKAPKKVSDEDDDLEEFDEDLEDDLDGVDEDDDLEDLEEELDEEEDENEDAEDEEDESDEAEESDEDGTRADPYDKREVKVKVNGKWKKFTGAQMKQMVASGAHLEEQRSSFQQEVTRTKADFDSNMAKLKEADDLLKPIYEAATKGDAQAAVIKTFELRGIDKVTTKWRLIEQMTPLIGEILGIQPEALEARIKERLPNIRQMKMRDENEFYKEQQKNPPADSQKEADKAGEREVIEFMDSHDISRPQLRSAVQWLKENTYKGKEGEITLPVISKFVNAKRAVDKAVTAIGAVSPKLARDQKFVDRVISLCKTKPDWTADKVARWVRQKAKGTKTAETNDQVNELRKDVSRKVLKTNNKSALNKSTPNSQKKPKIFADLYGGNGETLDI